MQEELEREELEKEVKLAVIVQGNALNEKADIQF